MSSRECVSIPLTKGFTAFVGVEDAELASLKWHVTARPGGKPYGARKGDGPGFGRTWLHRVVVERRGIEIPPGYVVDHLNGDTLDNRRENLRVVPIRHNVSNRTRAASHNQTGVLGVVRKRGRYRAQINQGGKRLVLGHYSTIEEAADARRRAEVQLRGELAAFWKDHK